MPDKRKDVATHGIIIVSLTLRFRILCRILNTFRFWSNCGRNCLAWIRNIVKLEIRNWVLRCGKLLLSISITPAGTLSTIFTLGKSYYRRCWVRGARSCARFISGRSDSGKSGNSWTKDRSRLGFLSCLLRGIGVRLSFRHDCSTNEKWEGKKEWEKKSEKKGVIVGARTRRVSTAWSGHDRA